MAVTYSVSGLTKGNAGNLRHNTGILTATGTPTAAGDAITAARLGLTRIENLVIQPLAKSDRTEAFVPAYVLSGNYVTFYASGASAGDALPDEVAGAGTGYTARFSAFGV